MLKMSWCLFLAFLSAASAASFAKETETTLGFDGLADLVSNVDSLGVKFTGATVLACGGSLNCTGFPPASGRNVIYDGPSSGGLITATFDASLGPITKVSAKITGNRTVTITAFDTSGGVIESRNTGGANYVGAPGGLPPNIQLTIVPPTGTPISKVTFHDHGNTFTVDDFTFTANPTIFVLDPGHGLLRDNDNILRYQRPPTKKYGLREDNLTLAIANTATSRLTSGSHQVYMTRSSANALYTGPCGVYSPSPKDQIETECAPDVRLRAKVTEKHELTGENVVFVSVHTNGGSINRFLRGRTQTFYCSPQSNALSLKLLEKITAVVPPTGLASGGYQTCTDYWVIANPSGAMTHSSLVEALYHSNADDEELLNQSSVLDQIGNAIGDAVVEFAKTIK